MKLNNLSSDGASQYSLNDAFTHEMAVQTSGPDAETPASGVRVTMISVIVAQAPVADRRPLAL